MSLFATTVQTQMESFIPVYQHESIIATGNRFVGSKHAKTCVILALRHDKKVVLAHIDAMCLNSVQDMAERLPEYDEVHVACPKVSTNEYNVWAHVQQYLKPWVSCDVGHESCLAICPESGEVVREWGSEVTEETSEKWGRGMKMILTLEKSLPLRWFTFDGNTLTCEWELPRPVFTFGIK